jgi:hypothetical protein
MLSLSVGIARQIILTYRIRIFPQPHFSSSNIDVISFLETRETLGDLFVLIDCHHLKLIIRDGDLKHEIQQGTIFCSRIEISIAKVYAIDQL